MSAAPIAIKFRNQFNPRSAFDLIRLEDLLKKTFSDHDPKRLHKVNFFILIFITGGDGKHTIDFTDYRYKSHTLLTIRKDQIQKFWNAPKARGYLLLFKDEFLLEYLEKLEAQKTLQLFNELLGSPRIQLDATNFNTVLDSIKRMHHEYAKNKDAYSLSIIRSELHILITKLYRFKASTNNRIINKKYLSEFILFQNLIETHITETTKVADYARKMAISTKTLTTISKSIVNKTAKEFIDEIAIKQIKRLLINTSLSIKEIAITSGFEETTNFYKFFKKRVGLTPEKFRLKF